MQAHEEGGAEPCELAIYKSVSHIHRSKPVVESETTDLPQMSTLAGPLDGVLQNPIRPRLERRLCIIYGEMEEECH
jgi:hypothetical protein